MSTIRKLQIPNSKLQRIFNHQIPTVVINSRLQPCFPDQENPNSGVILSEMPVRLGPTDLSYLPDTFRPAAAGRDRRSARSRSHFARDDMAMLLAFLEIRFWSFCGLGAWDLVLRQVTAHERLLPGHIFFWKKFAPTR
jgi:hypothetical protein